MLLPEEVDLCSVTGRTVDRRLLAASEASGTLGLARLMVECSMTGKKAHPTEVSECQVTERPVLLAMLEKCTATGKVARRDKMVQSQVSGAWVLEDVAVRSVLDGAICLPKESVRCHWEGGPILIGQAGRCTLTNLTFARRWLNTDGEFGILKGLLDGRVPGTTVSGIVEWLQRRDRLFRKVSGVSVARSGDKDVLAVAAMTSSLFGLRQLVIGLLLSLDRRSKVSAEVLGQVVVGKRTRRGWELETVYRV